MENSEIISSIKEIYERFKIPKNLQEHMLRVAASGELICDNWDGVELDKDMIVATLLIHDLGNLMKMDLDSEICLKLMGNEADRINYWKEVKKEIMEKYGKDDHEVTLNMANELAVSERMKFLLINKAFEKNKETFESDDWELKICAYTDQRIGPFGVLSLKKRMDDFRERYKSRISLEYINSRIEFGQKIEEQLKEKMSILPEEINDGSIQKYIEKYTKKRLKEKSYQ